MSEDVKTNAPRSIDELKPGMAITGTVKRIELYGAFVDIGVGQDALLHISQLGKPNVRNVEDVVKVGEQVTLYVLKVEKSAGRIAVSLVQPPDVNWDDLREGAVLTGKVIRIEKFGVFVDVGAERPGMVHVSELADGFVKSPSDLVKVDQEVQVRVLKINRKKRQIDLSMKPEAEEYIVQADEDEEEAPTAMALAFRRAMEGQTEERRKSEAAKASKRNRAEQDDIIARTLRQHSN